MTKRKQIKRLIYRLVLFDVVAVLILTYLYVRSDSPFALACGAPLLFLVSYLYLRRNLEAIRAHPDLAETPPSSDIFYLYAGSVIFFLGALYGLVQMFEGKLPWLTLLGLAVPLMLSVYFLRAARRKARVNGRRGAL